jgi:4-hydroxy-tetrahydrodipicolinate reductase
VNVLLNGRGGKVGSVLAPALEEHGHTLVESLDDADAMVDFTAPAVALPNIEAAIAAGVPSVVGTSGWDTEAVRAAPVTVFYAPNFAVGAVLMMRFAEEAAKHLPRAEIIELHHETKVDAPSGTAKATAARIAHQEVLLGSSGELLTIRHDTTSREAFVPGVLLALEKLHSLPPGLTVGLDALL